MDEIPQEVFNIILLYLPVKDVCKNVKNVCRKFQTYFLYYAKLKMEPVDYVSHLLMSDECYDPSHGKCYICEKDMCFKHSYYCTHDDWTNECYSEFYCYKHIHKCEIEKCWNRCCEKHSNKCYNCHKYICAEHLSISSTPTYCISCFEKIE